MIILFVCNENKNNFFLSSVSVFDKCSGERHNVWCCCWRRSRRSVVEPGCSASCLQAEVHETVFINMSEDFDRWWLAFFCPSLLIQTRIYRWCTERWTLYVRMAAPASAALHACVVILSWTCVKDWHGRVENVEYNFYFCFLLAQKVFS